MKLRKQFEGHSFGIGCIAWCPFSRYIIACGTDECNELWIWDVEVNILINDEYHSLSFLARRTTITDESYIRR
jgi:WD40 repeat protein